MRCKLVKRVVVAGCRNYNNYTEAKEFIDMCLSRIRKENEIIIISGGAKGADTLGELYAQENGFRIERYIAQWEKYGKRAGPIRNEEMAKNADYVICLWDGKSRGTKSMIECAKKQGKPYKIKMIR